MTTGTVRDERHARWRRLPGRGRFGAVVVLCLAVAGCATDDELAGPATVPVEVTTPASASPEPSSPPPSNPVPSVPPSASPEPSTAPGAGAGAGAGASEPEVDPYDAEQVALAFLADWNRVFVDPTDETAVNSPWAEGEAADRLRQQAEAIIAGENAHTGTVHSRITNVEELELPGGLITALVEACDDYTDTAVTSADGTVLDDVDSDVREMTIVGLGEGSGGRVALFGSPGRRC